MKNINEKSDFIDRTGLIVSVSNKRNVNRLMKYGVLHYISKKMSYAILYVDTKKEEEIINKIRKENYVSSVKKSQLKDLPIEYDSVLDQLNKEIKDIICQVKLENLFPNTFSKNTSNGV